MDEKQKEMREKILCPEELDRLLFLPTSEIHL